MAQELANEDVLDQRKETAHAAVRLMNELFTPLNAALKDVHPRAQIDMPADRYTQNWLTTSETSASPEIVFTFLRLSQITSGPSYNVFALRLGRGIELTGDGELIFRSYVDVSYPGLSGFVFDWHSEDHTAPVGSVQADVMLRKAVAETGRKLMEGIDAFIEHVGQRG